MISERNIFVVFQSVQLPGLYSVTGTRRQSRQMIFRNRSESGRRSDVACRHCFGYLQYMQTWHEMTVAGLSRRAHRLRTWLVLDNGSMKDWDASRCIICVSATQLEAARWEGNLPTADLGTGQLTG
eukprot:811523_1